MGTFNSFEVNHLQQAYYIAAHDDRLKWIID